MVHWRFKEGAAPEREDSLTTLLMATTRLLLLPLLWVATRLRRTPPHQSHGVRSHARPIGVSRRPRSALYASGSTIASGPASSSSSSPRGFVPTCRGLVGYQETR